VLKVVYRRVHHGLGNEVVLQTVINVVRLLVRHKLGEEIVLPAVFLLLLGLGSAWWFIKLTRTWTGSGNLIWGRSHIRLQRLFLLVLKVVQHVISIPVIELIVKKLGVHRRGDGTHRIALRHGRHSLNSLRHSHSLRSGGIAKILALHLHLRYLHRVLGGGVQILLLSLLGILVVQLLVVLPDTGLFGLSLFLLLLNSFIFFEA